MLTSFCMYFLNLVLVTMDMGLVADDSNVLISLMRYENNFESISPG